VTASSLNIRKMTEQNKVNQRPPPPQLRTTDWTASSFHEMQTHRNSENISPRSMGDSSSNDEVSPEEAETPLTSTGNKRDESNAATPVPPGKPAAGPAEFQTDWRDEMRRIIREEGK
jgi:hypothetical protein